MMDIIYGNAERVCIWLGEANESSRMALRFIKHEVSHLQSFDSLCESKDASKKWVALLDLMQRPWFSRRWVVQELALAQKPIIYCGNDRISWKKFAIAVELFVEVETATHRLSEVMKKDRQYQYIPSYFDYVSALGASLLVDATERLFRDYQEVEIIQPTADPNAQVETYTNSDSDTSIEVSGSESDSSISLNINSAQKLRHISKNRIQPLLSLEYLVSSLTIFDTTVPHDTIYALLAIAKDTTPRAVASGSVVTSRGAQEGLEIYTQRKSYNVDYKLPYVDVCKDFLLFSIERSLEGNASRALDVICRPWAIEERKLKKIREDKKLKKDKEERDKRREKDREMRRAWRQARGTHSPLPRAAAPSSASSGLFGNASFQEDDNVDLEDMALPSWVPQLSGAPHAMAQRPGLNGPKMSRINADPLVGLPSITQRNYSAAETKGVDMKALRFRKRPKLGHFSMYVRGFQLDVIKEVEQVARNGQIPREWAELVRWQDAKGHPPDAFWRTLVANRGKDGKNPPVYYSRACQESFKKGGLESGAVDTTALIDYERNSVVAQFCRRVQAVTWNRALVRTEAGRLALVGKDVEKDDLVCILYGCSVPVVLRGSAKKTRDVFEAEVEQELIDVKDTVVQNFRRYMSRKRRHETRKDIEMGALCRRWFKATDYIHNNGFSPCKLSKEATKEGLLRILVKAISDFKTWWINERYKQWDDIEKTMRQQREDAKTKKSKPGKKEMDEVLHKQREKQQEVEVRAQRKRRKSRSTIDMLDSAPVPTLSAGTFSVGGAGSGTAKDALLAAKKRKSVIDWWAFEHALVAFRRWKQIVKERRDSRVAFALKNTQVDWMKQKHDEYEAFKVMRTKEAKWVDVPQIAGEQHMTNGNSDAAISNGTNGKHDSEVEDHLRLGNCINGKYETNGDHAQDLSLKEIGLDEDDAVCGGSEDAGANDMVSPMDAGPSNSHLPSALNDIVRDTSQSTQPTMEVRPSWASRTNNTKLSLHESAEYDIKIRNNLRERLGEEGWFSYKLLGECYIHGVMDGEAMLYQNEGDDKIIPSMVFEIR